MKGNRLRIYRWTIAVVAIVLCCAIAVSTLAGSRTFNVRETVTFVNDGPGVCTELKVVVGLFQDWSPYIDVLSETISPASHTIFTDDLGNRFAEIIVKNLAKGQRVPVTLTWRIEVEELSFDLNACDNSAIPSDLAQFLGSESYIESDNAQIKAKALSLASGKSGPCEIVEAIYDYVIDNMTYAGYVAENRGAKYALTYKRGDCTEYATLMTALCRAAGIPARVIEGVTNSEDDEVHDWVEAYLPGLGWVPFDPTWGRHAGARDTWLAAVEPNHIPLYIGIGPDALDGYGYWVYWYWWGSTSMSISTTGYDWDVQ